MELALREPHGRVTLAAIAENQGISVSYLEQLFAKLRKRGLVDSARGPGGGYRLSRPGEEIAVVDVITAVDEKVDATRCAGEANCQGNERCLTHDLWASLSEHVRSFLEEVTLASLMQRPGVQAVAARNPSVTSVEAKPATRNPSAPFMTSTLQQEASRKFGMGARQCMNTAQRLYEAGLITYMRTDGIDMAPEAVADARGAIETRYGKDYVPASARVYKNKAKNAQEAHECIRPTEMSKSPAEARISEADQKKLYDLIWKRTLASQMEAARLERTSVDIGSADGQVVLRANGQVILFDGFLAVYEEGRDDVVDDDDKRLPQMSEGDTARKSLVNPEQHFTQPPPRYTEATLVKRMEELGIGRPSTYASVISTIQDREYVRKEKNRLIPEDKGRIVTIFLLNFFKRYVEYDFTAALEDELDHVSAGEGDYKALLSRFWRDFSAAIAETSDLRITEVLDVLDDALAPQLYPPREDGTDPRICPKCGQGQLHLKTSRTGGFVGCGNYPECTYTRPIAGEGAEGEERVLGEDQGDEIWLKSGRFGPYVQRGEPTPENKKPPRASLPKAKGDFLPGWSPDDMTLEKAVTLLTLPRIVGMHPDGGEVKSNLGRFGPYIMHQLPDEPKPVYVNLKEFQEVFEIGMNRSVELLAEKRANPGRGRGAAAKPLKTLGEHPQDGGPVAVMEGRYGPYVKWEKVNATLPKDVEPDDVTMDVAVKLIAEKAAKKGGKKKAAPKKAAPKTAPKTAAPKKAAARKPAAKKTATKASGAKKKATPE